MLNAFIADDEKLARKRLHNLLSPLVDSGRVQVVGEAEDGVGLLEKLPEQEVDVLFLDIQMPELSGLEALRRLSPEERPAIIFTTAYDRYALQAFEENAVDYLLKPISRERLEKAVRRVEETRAHETKHQLNSDQLARLMELLDQNVEAVDASGSDDGYPEQITVSYGDRIRIVPVNRVISIEIDDGVTRLYFIDEEAAGGRAVRHHVIDYTLDHLEENLDPEAFMRVHRSAIVHLHHIQEMIPWFSGRFKLIMSGDHEVVASRERSKQLKERLMI